MKLFKKVNLNHLILLFCLLFIFLIPFFVFAQDGTTKNLLNNVADSAGYEKGTSAGDVISAVINGFFALIGTIFLIYIFYSGYLWIGAPGEEQVKKAKDQMKNAIWGIIVVIGAYAIVKFVLDALFEVGGGGGPGGS
ncbi:MAG: pilin [Patescibacteria group bacterium]|jgi:amino acid transporter